MATRNPLENLPEETSCSICLGFFQEPVSIHCGHNFCRGCITRCWAGQGAPFSCPQCRQEAPQQSFRPSRELAKLSQLTQQHQEALKLFCQEDQELLCLVCHLSRAHRSHTVLPAEEAAREYK
ncbi:PREDICTED: tripartite motif-containing protein 52-like, partial [Merops nubicus]|uniref:tripartite motif-containing protein 52-like n=1 Tax=Merops nubicus TaxID=57421 RepID=UPI0004F05270